MNFDLKDYNIHLLYPNALSAEQHPIHNKNSLKSHVAPDRPWAKIATDLFSFKENDYLILVDYYSNFWGIDLLPNTESITGVRKLKAHLARYGIPGILMSDNDLNILYKPSFFWKEDLFHKSTKNINIKIYNKQSKKTMKRGKKKEERRKKKEERRKKKEERRMKS